jgi:hypothetical protein
MAMLRGLVGDSSRDMEARASKDRSNIGSKLMSLQQWDNNANKGSYNIGWVA